MNIIDKAWHKGRKGDIKGVRNFIDQEVEDFTESKGIKNKAKSLATSGRQAIGAIKDKVIDKASDAMSYPARRAAQKAMIKADKRLDNVRLQRDVNKKAQSILDSQRKSLEEASKKKPFKVGKFSDGVGVGP